MCEMIKLGELLWVDSKDIWNGYLEGFKGVSLWIDCEGEGGWGVEEGLLEQKLQSLRFWPGVEQHEGMTAPWGEEAAEGES